MFNKFNNLEKVQNALENGFYNPRILVIGDLMLDRYLWGEVDRISPEAPVPVVRVVRQTESAGGAANVALNLSGLGAAVSVAGIIGDDEPGGRLKKLLEASHVDTGLILSVTGRKTVTKNRVIGGHQQMTRFDIEELSGYSTIELESLFKSIGLELEKKLDAIVLSDYAKGVLSEKLCRKIIEKARGFGIPVFADPKGLDYSKYKGATALTPNLQELARITRISVKAEQADWRRAGERLRESLELDFLVVTRGQDGMTLISDNINHVPAMALDVFDVSGAGDTVIATLVAGSAAGLDRLDVLHLANIAAGVVVGKVGTVPIDRTDLLGALSDELALEQSHKIADLDVLLRMVSEWRARGKRIVFTNGCFDLLHAGHVIYLEKARREGDCMVVGLNSDRSVRALKGESRPVIPQHERARVLAALSSVDAVILFDEDTPLKLIDAVRPDVIAKGSDYTEDQVVGGKEVKSWGGRVVLIPLVQGRSTTDILSRINSSDKTKS